MKIPRKAILDSVHFANFAQKFKMLYWDGIEKMKIATNLDIVHLPEDWLDYIALELWKYIKK